MYLNIGNISLLPSWQLKISMLGSVQGLQAGLKRSLVMPNFLKNSCMIPMRSPSVSPQSATEPSIWWNSAKCVSSTFSFLNTLSIEKYFTGLNSFCKKENSQEQLSTVQYRFYYMGSSFYLLYQCYHFVKMYRANLIFQSNDFWTCSSKKLNPPLPKNSVVKFNPINYLFPQFFKNKKSYKNALNVPGDRKNFAMSLKSLYPCTGM